MKNFLLYHYFSSLKQNEFKFLFDIFFLVNILDTRVHAIVSLNKNDQFK